MRENYNDWITNYRNNCVWIIFIFQSIRNINRRTSKRRSFVWIWFEKRCQWFGPFNFIPFYVLFILRRYHPPLVWLFIRFIWKVFFIVSWFRHVCFSLVSILVSSTIFVVYISFEIESKAIEIEMKMIATNLMFPVLSIRNFFFGPVSLCFRRFFFFCLCFEFLITFGKWDSVSSSLNLLGIDGFMFIYINTIYAPGVLRVWVSVERRPTDLPNDDVVGRENCKRIKKNEWIYFLPFDLKKNNFVSVINSIMMTVSSTVVLMLRVKCVVPSLDNGDDFDLIEIQRESKRRRSKLNLSFFIFICQGGNVKRKKCEHTRPVCVCIYLYILLSVCYSVEFFFFSFRRFGFCVYWNIIRGITQ